MMDPFPKLSFCSLVLSKRELHVSVLSFVYISDIDRSGRIILPNLVIYAQHSSLGERRLLLNCELPYKQGRFLHTEADPQSLCLACAQLTRGAVSCGGSGMIVVLPASLSCLQAQLWSHLPD